MSEHGGHRKMTKSAAQDLAWLMIMLGLIIAAMLAYQATLGKDVQGDNHRDWYYENIASKSRSARPRQ